MRRPDWGHARCGNWHWNRRLRTRHRLAEVNPSTANFSIVTETTFTLQDQINDGNTVVASFTFTAASNLSIFEHFQLYDDTLPAELSLQLAISYDSTVDLTNTQLSLFYLGPVADDQPCLDAAYALGPLFNASAILTQPALLDQTT